ncbi:hypothetical protein [Streptomyces sp. NBC_00286]|uniref:hypothetical protein n=1 Tax=Streptomyces sp. NBC_00286 TaxID=2975701 RepID=UPI002E292E82|nr:hypothetical protein [Streptomyces sp. NBC_00286]
MHHHTVRSETAVDLAVELNPATKATGAYPLVEIGYALVCTKGNNPQQLPVLRSFLDYVISKEAQKSAANLGYAPVPPNWPRAYGQRYAGSRDRRPYRLRYTPRRGRIHAAEHPGT